MSLHISHAEFLDYQAFVYEHTGISMHEGKKALICGRLSKRLQYHQINSYAEYFALIQSPQGASERQICIDLLTTNETYFSVSPSTLNGWLSTCSNCHQANSPCAYGVQPAPAGKRHTALP